MLLIKIGTKQLFENISSEQATLLAAAMGFVAGTIGTNAFAMFLEHRRRMIEIESLIEGIRGELAFYIKRLNWYLHPSSELDQALGRWEGSWPYLEVSFIERNLDKFGSLNAEIVERVVHDWLDSRQQFQWIKEQLSQPLSGPQRNELRRVCVEFVEKLTSNVQFLERSEYHYLLLFRRFSWVWWDIFKRPTDISPISLWGILLGWLTRKWRKESPNLREHVRNKFGDTAVPKEVNSRPLHD